jgi:xylose isomerase
MDAFAHALRIAAKIVKDGTLDSMVSARYSSFNLGIGKKIEDGQTNFEELEKWVLEHGEPEQRSGKQEKFESIFNQFFYKILLLLRPYLLSYHLDLPAVHLF